MFATFKNGTFYGIKLIAVIITHWTYLKDNVDYKNRIGVAAPSFYIHDPG